MKQDINICHGESWTYRENYTLNGFIRMKEKSKVNYLICCFRKLEK
jgi:hypothetical protein